MKKIAIITGASGGIEKEFLKELSKEPLDEIWVIGRTEEKLLPLKKEFGNKIIPVCKDLTLSSASSFQPVPYINLYAATKAFERSYSRALNVELKPMGITVTAVCPSWVDTKMLTKNINGQTVRFPGIVSPKKVALKAIKDVKKGKDMSVCSFYVKCQHLNVKLMPQKLTMKLWMNSIGKYL